MSMKTYVYHGPDSGATLDMGKEQPPLEAMLWNGRPVELPSDNLYVRRLVALKRLTEVTPPPVPVSALAKGASKPAKVADTKGDGSNG